MKVTKTKTKTPTTSKNADAIFVRLGKDNKEFLFREGLDLSLKHKKTSSLANTVNHIITTYKAIKKDSPKVVEKHSPATL